MPQGPAARVGDPVAHPLPPVLGPGPGSVNVLIGGMPAWRGMPLAAVAGLMSAKASSDVAVATAVAASTAAAGTPGAPAAIAAETTAKQTASSSMAAAMSGAGAGADTHMCATPFPPTVPLPHSQGMVITGSLTVLINNLPACRAGDTILECLGPPNSIAMGCPTVIIGDSMYMGQGTALATAAGATSTLPVPEGHTRVYRAVSEAEYEDVVETGQLQQGPNSMEGKWFADSLEGAEAHGKALFPDGKYRMIEVDVPDNAPSLFRLPNLDGRGPARYLHMDDLKDLSPRPLE